MSQQNDDAALKALKDGAQTAAQVASATGMTKNQAHMAINHLETTGKVEVSGGTTGSKASTTYKPTNP